MSPPARRCLLAVFAHPDDETSAAAGTLIHYARAGVDIHVVTATRGERGDLGTGDLTIARHDLPAVREAELRAVLALYGAHPPILLDSRDQELRTADFATLTQDVLRAMATVRPSYCTQCRTLRSTDQRGGFGTAFLPKIQ
jgi:LmbE family N-acetylglucosaminyl deacetylase